MRALMRELRGTPNRLMVVLKDSQLNVTTGDGTVHTLPLNDKKIKVTLAGETIEARAKWDGANIVTQWTAGQLKVDRTYQSSPDGKVLTVVVAPHDKDKGAGRLAMPTDGCLRPSAPRRKSV